MNLEYKWIGKTSKSKFVPWILIICPNFSAAPRILDSFRTRRSIFDALNMSDEGDSDDDDVARRRDSLIAPKPIPAASPP